jgi:rod shape-determining protein MreB
MILDNIFSFFSKDMAIDLGTANTLIHIKNEGIVLDEPSMVAISRKDDEIIAIGREAKEMYGKTPDTIKTIRPMKDGVIADFEITQRMIKYFIQKIHNRKSLLHPQTIIAIPSGITQVEKRAVIDSAEQSGVRKVHLVEEPMAAAIGSKLPIDKAIGNMVIDIGGGTTEVAVISKSAIAYSESIRIAGDEMDEAVAHFIKKRYNLDIGIFEAERVKMEIGSAFTLKNKLETVIRGIDLVKGIPKEIKVDDEAIRESLDEPVSSIVNAIKKALEKITPEFAREIMSRGVVLAGGGSLLKGLGPRLHKETNLRIYRANDPLKAVVRGAGEILENFKEMRKVCIN